MRDSDSDLPEQTEIEQDNDINVKRGVSKSKSAKHALSTCIREDNDEIVDLVDLKSIGNVLSE